LDQVLSDKNSSEEGEINNGGWSNSLEFQMPTGIGAVVLDKVILVDIQETQAETCG
jgi:hypothetical protein